MSILCALKHLVKLEPLHSCRRNGYAVNENRLPSKEEIAIRSDFHRILDRPASCAARSVSDNPSELEPKRGERCSQPTVNPAGLADTGYGSPSFYLVRVVVNLYCLPENRTITSVSRLLPLQVCVLGLLIGLSDRSPAVTVSAAIKAIASKTGQSTDEVTRLLHNSRSRPSGQTVDDFAQRINSVLDVSCLLSDIADRQRWQQEAREVLCKSKDALQQ